MSDWLMAVYDHLPSSARSVAATLHGYRLRRWRYGKDTERIIEEALDREHWSANRWNAWQDERLALLLRRAATLVPYYRQQWRARRLKGDRCSCEYLENWPILDKEALRANPAAFVAEDRDVRSMYLVHTSGTTGKPLDLWRSRETSRAWYALYEARSQRWYGVSRHDRWAILGGQLVAPVTQEKPPFWVWNAAFNQLYMSSYHLSPNLIREYLAALERYRVKYLLGYPSSLYALAQEALRSRNLSLKMEVAITNAEPVFDYQRETISEAFQCSVCETYGMTEIAAAASQCPHGVLHLWPEVGWVEVLNDDGVPTPDGTIGDLICTGLLNEDMPFVRYKVGDLVCMRGVGAPCSCGRTLPVLDSVEGRTDDVLYTTDGRRIGRLDPVFKVGLPVREAQIVQETLNRVRVRYVPAPDFTSDATRSIVSRLRARMGRVEVVLEELPQIPRGANGKFRAVICDLPPRQRERVQATQWHSAAPSSS
jgi:phenylacetate-CoA ligase